MEGLEKFREAFADFSENYVVIGGTACTIAMEGTLVRPRATHDIDMIVIAEKITDEFGERLWQFVKEAGYRPEKKKHIEGESPKYELYRFVDGKDGYPEMIELLSRHPNVLGEPKGLRIEPLPLGEEPSSMSAIIMDDDCYQFAIDHSRMTNGIRHADPVALVALKAKAYLNLLSDKKNGRHVNDKDIRKHRSDVLKNVVIIEDESIEAPATIVECIHEFVDSIQADWDNLAKSLAAALDRDTDFIAELLEILRQLFVKKR